MFGRDAPGVKTVLIYVLYPRKQLALLLQATNIDYLPLAARRSPRRYAADVTFR